MVCICICMHSYNETLLSQKKKWYSAISNYTDGPRGYHAEKDKYSVITLWNLKHKTKEQI